MSSSSEAHAASDAEARGARFDAVVFVGRFQPFHNGHLALLNDALGAGREVVVVLGSACQARSPKNPFTWNERARMIELAAAPADRHRIRFVPVRDYYDNSKWLAAVKAGVATAVPSAASIAVIGHFKDATSYYLDLFQGWQLLSVERQGGVDATHLRRALFSGATAAAALNAVQEHMPVGALDYLRAWIELPFHKTLTEEWQAIKRYRDAWSGAPYEPVFVTVDSVVFCENHVLLVRRGQMPGAGLWALPGGFVEKNERLLQSAMRELQEETGLGLLPSTLEQSFREAKVFDHPQRSLRGRTITHAHLFDLGKTGRLPAVSGADDASEAHWVPIAKLHTLEEQFFEDHFVILNHFLEARGR
ncbi:MAG TPA: bifunctional nicotinamide-nucleotide adenylyltransferase/Nudix hydroxylase [Burkholderiaceae bacterium]|nr:bifunctional nicotinamide-nucleotide adenylyltransferase/Nudix hydroxylase [Burkholderiaceae bacterium]